MIYLLGLKITNGVSKKLIRFKYLRIPFKRKKELEKFTLEMEKDLNPDIDMSDVTNFNIKWVDYITVNNKNAELYKRK
jgi:hypothetical protein